MSCCSEPWQNDCKGTRLGSKRRNQILRLLLRQYPIQSEEQFDLDVGKDVAGAMQRAIPATLADGDVATASASSSAYSEGLADLWRTDRVKSTDTTPALQN